MKFDDEFMDIFAEWRNDDLEQLNYIVGYSESLKKGELGDLTDEQREAVNIINARAQNIYDFWKQRSDLVKSSSSSQE